MLLHRCTLCNYFKFWFKFAQLLYFWFEGVFSLISNSLFVSSQLSKPYPYFKPCFKFQLIHKSFSHHLRNDFFFHSNPITKLYTNYISVDIFILTHLHWILSMTKVLLGSTRNTVVKKKNKVLTFKKNLTLWRYKVSTHMTVIVKRTFP